MGSPMLVTVASSIVSYYVALWAVARARPILLERGVYGIDINKTTLDDRKKIRAGAIAQAPDHLKKFIVPESLGIIIGAVYLCVVTACLLLAGLPLPEANAAISSIAVMLLLGFVDDVLDVRWRIKIVLSAFATLPLVCSYTGMTSVMLPIQLRGLLGMQAIHLGDGFVVVLSLICIFCTNSINILAGVNGLEVGQSIVIAVAAAIHNVVQIYRGEDATHHTLSFVILAPFIACCWALFRFNRYPSSAFVGDSFTYMSGMTLAVAAITGGYVKTMMLFFLPQLINFIISLPQLFHIIECPRHRIPTWDPETDLLHNSRNLTILNGALVVFGPMSEKRLANVLILFQAVCCALGFFIRYVVAGMAFEAVH